MIRRALGASSVLLALAFVGCGDKGDGKPVAPPAGNAKPADAAAAGGYGYAANLGDDLDKRVGDSLKKARKFLLAQRDDATGMFKAQGPVVGFTAIATMALIASTARESVASDPTIAKSLEFLASKQKADGSIAGEKQDWANYETSASICAFANARVAKFSATQAKARDYVLSLQIQGDEKDVNFGGFPYEKEGDLQDTSDLSNAQYAAAAAHDAGVTDKAFWARLVKFLDRSQNRSEGNDSVVKVKVGDVEKQAVSGNDGGAGYGPGKSKAGWIERPDGKVEPRSYGSMTYALLKCLLYAGVKTDDPRVQAAIAWLSKNFTVDRNPGFESDKDATKGMQGYYYFLETMSRALAEYEKTTGKALVVTDAAGKPHAWRRELSAKIVSLQKADGTWSNDQDRWEEGSPLLVTSYMVEALATCQGTSAVAAATPPSLASAALAATAPAVAAILVAVTSNAVGAERLFRADGAGIIVAAATGAFAVGRVRVATACLAGPALLAGVHAFAGGWHGVAAIGAIAAVAAGVATAAGGLAAFGRSASCPAAAAGAIAAVVLWIACGAVWWADRAAALVPPSQRGEIRQAVLTIDPLTSAAYGAANYRRLHDPDVYEGTTIATSAVIPPDASETAALWGATGVLFLALAAGVRRVRGVRPPHDSTAPATEVAT